MIALKNIFLTAGIFLALTLTLTLTKSADVSAQSCTPPPANLVSWWPGDGNANDIKNGNPGTLQNGTAFGAGKVGQAFSFDGVDDQVVIADSASLEPQTITVDFWFSSANPGQFAYLLSKGADGCNQGSYSFNKSGTTTGGLAFDVEVNGVLQRSPASSPAIFDGQLHFVVGTYDGTTIRLFVDGAEVGTGTVAPGTITYGLSTTDDLYLGTYPATCGAFNFHYAGLLDEVELFNRVLSLTEIQAIYNAGSAGKCIDADGDGIPDSQDACPNSIVTSTVIINGCDSGVANTVFPNGCSLSDRIQACATGARNHGAFVSCVAQLTNSLKKAGTITGEQKGAIQSCAAQSNN